MPNTNMKILVGNKSSINTTIQWLSVPFRGCSSRVLGEITTQRGNLPTLLDSLENRLGAEVEQGLSDSASLLPFQGTQVRFPAPTPADSQPPAAPALGDRILSSDFHRHQHTHVI